MTQVLEKPPVTDNSTGQRFYLLALSNAQTLYWEGNAWSASRNAAQVFRSYEAAYQERPRASKKAPVGSSVVVSEL
jgi:hypothetical protein